MAVLAHLSVGYNDYNNYSNLCKIKIQNKAFFQEKKEKEKKKRLQSFTFMRWIWFSVKKEFTSLWFPDQV